MPEEPNNLQFEGDNLTFEGEVITFQSEPEPPAEPTFGLPPDVVALITSRFGSVARFLRLRNQGQI
jgi:hypothetical protein